MASSPPRPSKKPRMSSSTSTSDADDDPTACAPSAAGEPRRRYKRRKVAIFLGYCGAGYQGMQKNPGARTIEGDLEEALFRADAVPAADCGLPRRYDWARSARTDKGVSAAAQVVSGRFYVDPPGFVDRLNSHLPEQIRVFGFKRATNSFNAKKFCDRRRYVYLLPVFALDSTSHPDREAVMASVGSDNELGRCLECSERGRKIPGLMGRFAGRSKEEEKEASDFASLGFEEGATEDGNNKSESDKLQVFDFESAGGSNCKLDASSMISETKKSTSIANDEVSTGKLVSDDSAASAAITSLDTVLEIEASNEERCSKPSNDDETMEEKPMVEIDVSLTAQPVEPKIPDGTNGEQVAVKKEFCYGDEQRERFNKILKHYVGTHNFHNFTTRTKAEDPSARRYIISFDANQVVCIDGIEFVRCEVVGQSFMLHQIRKMIGLAVAVMRNCAPESLMDVALRKDVSINVPTAPEVGLYLDECLFTSYNQKWKDSHEALSMEAYAEEAEEFKMKYIFSHIASMEHKEGAVALWLHSLNHRNYPDFRFMETYSERGAGKDQVDISSKDQMGITGKDQVDIAGKDQVDISGKDQLDSVDISGKDQLDSLGR